LEQSYYDGIKAELLSISGYLRTKQRMNVICSENGKTYNLRKQSILVNILKNNGKYISSKISSKRRNYGWYPSYEEAVQAVQELGISGSDEYRLRYKEDPRLPSNPGYVYAESWTNFPTFLGKPSLYTFEEAKAVVQKLILFNKSEYLEEREKDPRFPHDPNEVYASKWKGMKDFLGITPYETLGEAKEAAASLGIFTRSEYLVKRKLDYRLLSNPDIFYEDEWVGWKDFLPGKAKNYKSKHGRCTFEEARAIVRGLGIYDWASYRCRYKENSKLPYEPNLTYCKDWKGWKEFCGSKYQTLSESKEAVRRLGITSIKEYRLKCRLDPKLYACPDQKYSDWTNWADYLGENYD
jgi:hypothetical protein